MRDIELWCAMHDECPIYGCGSCNQEVIELDDDLYADLAKRAKKLKKYVDVYILECIYAGLEYEMQNIRS